MADWPSDPYSRSLHKALMKRMQLTGIKPHVPMTDPCPTRAVWKISISGCPDHPDYNAPWYTKAAGVAEEAAERFLTDYYAKQCRPTLTVRVEHADTHVAHTFDVTHDVSPHCYQVRGEASP